MELNLLFLMGTFTRVLTNAQRTPSHQALCNIRFTPVEQTSSPQVPPRYANFSSDFVAYVNSAVEKVMHCYNITGLSLAAIDRRQAASNKIVFKFTKGYGIRDTTTNELVDENTKFAIGSITKSFTAATFANLTAASNSLLDYDALVGPILKKDFNTTLSNTGEHFNTFGNFRDLLSHRTSVVGLNGPLLTGTNLTVFEMVQALNSLPSLPHKLGGGFRESYLYNNWMYALVGALMSNANGGKSWKSLVSETILKPWSIGAKFIPDLVYGKDNFAMPVDLYANKSSDGSYEFYTKQHDLKFLQEWLGTNEILNPAGAIVASAEDMARYIEFWNVGGFGTIPAAAIAELNNPQTSLAIHIPTFRPPQFNYWDVLEYYTALGLKRGIHNNSLKFTHDGGIGPYVSRFTAFIAPYPQIGVFVATNGPGDVLAANTIAIIEQAVLEAIVTDGHPNQWALDNLCSVFPVNLSSLVPHPKPLNTAILLGDSSAYTGQYRHPLMGWIEIIVYNTTHLRWTLGTVGTGFMARSARDDLWQFDICFDRGLEWAQSALEAPPDWANTTVQFITEPVEGAEESGAARPAQSVILRFQGSRFMTGVPIETLPDELQPLFKRV